MLYDKPPQKLNPLLLSYTLTACIEKVSHSIIVDMSNQPRDLEISNSKSIIQDNNEDKI